MAEIVSIPELYSGAYNDLGAVQEVSMHFRAVHADGTEAWYYYGTDPVAMPPPAGSAATIVQRPAVRFPADFFNLPEASDLIRDLAYTVARDVATR